MLRTLRFYAMVATAGMMAYAAYPNPLVAAGGVISALVVDYLGTFPPQRSKDQWKNYLNVFLWLLLFLLICPVAAGQDLGPEFASVVEKYVRPVTAAYGSGFVTLFLFAIFGAFFSSFKRSQP